MPGSTESSHGRASDPRTPTDRGEPDSIGQEEKARRSLRRGLISLAVLAALVVGLVLAVPGLHGVGRQIGGMNVTWLLIAVGLEALSCFAYVLAFWQVFDRVPLRFGARVALTEEAFGAAVSLGGAGGIAIGAWLLVDRGGDVKRVAERSAVLFLLTSAVNVITLVIAGLGVFIGVLPGSASPLLSIVPAAVGVTTLALFFALPRVIERRPARPAGGRVHTLLVELAISIRLTEKVLFRWDWRTIGAFAYLWCDIGVLVACFAAAGHRPALAIVVLAYQIGYLVNALPVPGNIGILDGSLVAMFALYGISATSATAATVVYHAIALWIPSVIGTIAFILLRRTRNAPLVPRRPRRPYQPEFDESGLDEPDIGAVDARGLLLKDAQSFACGHASVRD